MVDQPNARVPAVNTADGTMSLPFLRLVQQIVNALNGTRDNTSGRVTIPLGQGSAVLIIGSGSPNGAVAASPPSLYLNSAGGAGTTFWVKESGAGNTGWTGK